MRRSGKCCPLNNEFKIDFALDIKILSARSLRKVLLVSLACLLTTTGLPLDSFAYTGAGAVELASLDHELAMQWERIYAEAERVAREMEMLKELEDWSKGRRAQRYREMTRALMSAEAQDLDRLAEMNRELERWESGKERTRQEEMLLALKSAEKERLRAMEKALEAFGGRIERRKGPKEERRTETGEAPTLRSPEGIRAYKEVTLDESQRGSTVEVEMDASLPLVINFPSAVRQVAVVDEGMLGWEQVGSKQVRFYSKGGLGKTVVYVWDVDGRWTLDLTVVPPRIIKEVERQAKRERERREHLKLSYSTDWWSYYEGEDFGDQERTDLGFTQTFSLFGPTEYGELSASATLEKEGDSYAVNYRFVSLRGINRFGLKDGSVTLGNYFGEMSRLSFPGSALDGVYVTEDRKDWRFKAFYGDTEDYWNYVPLVGESEATLKGFEIGWKDLSFRMAKRSGSEQGERRVYAEQVYSLGLDTELRDWRVSGEVAYDEEKWAGLLDLYGNIGQWSAWILLKDVEPGFRTVNGFPVYGGEYGIEARLDKEINRDRWGVYANVFRNKEYPNPKDPDRFNLEFSFDWSREEERYAYGWGAEYNDYRGMSGPYRNWELRGFYKRNLQIGPADLSWSAFLSHSDNKDELLDREYVVDRLTNRIDWDAIPGKLNLYGIYEVGQVEDKYQDEKTHPRVAELGVNLYGAEKTGKWSWSFLSGYRYESHGDLPYSFASNQDMLFLSGRLDYEIGEGRSWYVQADMRKYYPDDADRFVRSEVFVGLRWLWDTGLSLLPKVHIWGYVFEDANRNGVLDAGEKTLPGIRLRCLEKEVETDSKGKYDFGRLRGEGMEVEIDGTSLPVGMLPLTPVRPISFADGREQRVDFAVRYVSGVQVMVFLDKDKDGKWSSGDYGLSGVKVCVGEECRYTDVQGMIYFSGLEEGDYQVVLDPTTLDEGLLPEVPVRQPVHLPKGAIKKVYFPVKGLPRD